MLHLFCNELSYNHLLYNLSGLQEPVEHQPDARARVVSVGLLNLSSIALHQRINEVRILFEIEIILLEFVLYIIAARKHIPNHTRECELASEGLCKTSAVNFHSQMCEPWKRKKAEIVEDKSFLRNLI